MADLVVSDVAARLNVTPLTARRWLQAGSPGSVRCDDRGGCRIRERDLATLLDARCRMALRRKQAAEDQVRVAYGAGPAMREDRPLDHPVRTASRDRARAVLAEWGDLTAEELGALPIKDAIAAVQRRFYAEIGRPEPGGGRASRSRRRTTVVVPGGAAARLADKPVPV
jgi:hypothetical protein